MSTNLTSRLGRASAALAIACLAIFAAGSSVEARDYRGRGWHHHHHHHWNNGWHGWRSSNAYGYTWPQRYWRARPPTYYTVPRAYSYYPEPVGPSLSFTIPLR
jgi:hypothetical protein